MQDDVIGGGSRSVFLDPDVNGSGEVHRAFDGARYDLSNRNPVWGDMIVYNRNGNLEISRFTFVSCINLPGAVND